jgi:uncharacterized protein DUF4382
MNRKILAVILVAVGVSASVGFLFYGPAYVRLGITDPPPQPYDSSISAIKVTFTKIEIHVANASDQSGWHTLSTGGTVNLLSVLNVQQVLGTSSIPAGKYTEIRFFASQAIITINGTPVTYTIPGGNQTGFKVTVTGGGFQVVGGQTVNVQLDLAFRNSEIMNNPQHILTPVATASVVH